MRLLLSIIAIIFLFSCGSSDHKTQGGSLLHLIEDNMHGTISVVRGDDTAAILTQNAKEGIRPYIHPLVAPDGQGVLTEFSPSHHKHQTGLYWGLKEVNGRDYFMNWKEEYWKRVSAEVLNEKGIEVKWRIVYDLLGDKSNSILTETQTWSFTESEGKYLLDLIWKGEAHTDVTMGKFYVGGLFVRMPWHAGIAGEVINSAGQRNAGGEGQRAIWSDIGIQVPGRQDRGHIAILDHPDNVGFPSPWRVDNELGVGPSRQILGDWTIKAGETHVIRYRIVVYTGPHDGRMIGRIWKNYVCR